METMKRQPVIPVVVPAYNPPEQFEPFIRDLHTTHREPIIIVNDGSHPKFRPLFTKLGKLSRVTLVTHPKNLGKGAALKTAMRLIRESYPSHIGMISADADGQHVSVDIRACDRLARTAFASLIIGTRVDRLHMPLKSRTGNALTRAFFRLFHRAHVGDTQSGLRFIPVSLMALCMQSVFDKYDFELDMLVLAVRSKISIVEFPIQTIYINKNRASHFKSLKDSFSVAKVFWYHLFTSSSYQGA